jgi:hypothetical protein
MRYAAIVHWDVPPLVWHGHRPSAHVVISHRANRLGGATAFTIRLLRGVVQQCLYSVVCLGVKVVGSPELCGHLCEER